MKKQNQKHLGDTIYLYTFIHEATNTKWIKLGKSSSTRKQSRINFTVKGCQGKLETIHIDNLLLGKEKVDIIESKWLELGNRGDALILKQYKTNKAGGFYEMRAYTPELLEVALDLIKNHS